MKKEGKTIRNLVIGILVLMMTMALMAGCTEEPADTTAPDDTTPTKPVELNYDVYFNKTHFGALALDESDNTVHMTLWSKGKSGTVRVASVEVAKKIQAATTMLLVKDAKGIVTDIKAIEDVSAKFVAAASYVKAVDGNKITLTSGAYGAGWDLGTIELDAKTVMTDATGGSTIGAAVKLRYNDCIYAIANAEGKITHVIVISRIAEQRIAYCPHCDKDVTWTAHVADKGTVPTTAGHWYLTADMHSKAANVGANTIVLDLNGFTVYGTPAAKIYTTNNAKSDLHIMDLSEKKTGAMVASGDGLLTSAGAIVANSTSGSKFTLWSGTLDSSKLLSNQTGGVVYTASGCTFTMNGGKLIGGTVMGVINETSGADQGGRGGAINVGASGVVVINDGEIIGGTAKAGDAFTKRAQGGAIYVYAKASLTVNGGKISGGKADLGGDCVYTEDAACVVVNGGTVEKIDVKA